MGGEWGREGRSKIVEDFFFAYRLKTVKRDFSFFGSQTNPFFLRSNFTKVLVSGEGRRFVSV